MYKDTRSHACSGSRASDGQRINLKGTGFSPYVIPRNERGLVGMGFNPSIHPLREYPSKLTN
jgi:hypothetical protein